MGTILVVDDDPSCCRGMKQFLAIHGHMVVTASDLSSTLVVARDHAPDRALVDWLMPGNSGVRVLQELNSKFPSIPGALLTGWRERAEAEAKGSGILIFDKPAGIEVLEWLAGSDFTQQETPSGRGDSVKRRVLCITTCDVVLPRSVEATIVHTVAEFYRALKALELEIVLVDGAHKQMPKLVAISSEQGRCVYVLASDSAVIDRATAAGAYDAIAHDALATLPFVALAKCALPLPVSDWAKEEVSRIMESRATEEEKAERFLCVIAEEAIARHGGVRPAAVAARVSRATMIRRVTPTSTPAPTSSDAERSPIMSKHGQGRKR